MKGSIRTKRYKSAAKKKKKEHQLRKKNNKYDFLRKEYTTLIGQLENRWMDPSPSPKRVIVVSRKGIKRFPLTPCKLFR
jgi:hypothetical protein